MKLERGTVGCNKTSDKRESRGNTPKRFSLLKLTLLAVAVCVITLLAAALISTSENKRIGTAVYTVSSSKIETDGLRIVLISDLHRTRFDETNQQLVDVTAEQHPDLICVDGDMLERSCTEEEVEALSDLFSRLMAVAPVYFSAGNHDYKVYFNKTDIVGHEYVSGEGKSAVLQKLENTGAVFLENDYLDVEVCGQKLRLGGFYSKAYRTGEDTDESWSERETFLSKYCDTDSYKLMLSHRPQSFEPEKSGSDPDIDLILSGHTHSGVICLPFGLGAIWTEDGFFPKYDKGEFDIGTAQLIITSGLAGYGWIPRVFNPPEIAVIELLPEK